MRTERGSLSRRHFLYSAGALALAAPLLSACGGGDGGSDAKANSAKANSAVKLPAYVPFRGVSADLPAGQDLLPGFFGYPDNLTQAFSAPPAAGAGSVSLLVDTFGPVPPGVSGNGYWQELNKQVGADLQFNMVPDSDYSTKVASTLAGGDIKDIVMLPTWTPQLPQTLKALFQDLTPFLSGDAVKNYRFLANIPSFSWQPMIYNGGIYGIPTPRASIGNVLFSRDDLIAQRSLNANPASYQEFLELCQGLTDERAGHWALGNTGAADGSGALKYVLEITGAPNAWQVENGTFVNAVETEAYGRALGLVAAMVKKGVFHPDSFSATFQQGRDWYGTGKIALTLDGYAAWDIFRSTYQGIDVGALLAPGYDGGSGHHFTGQGTFALTALKKAAPERIKQLLAVCDWMAAPFGTAEQLFRKYGVSGEDYTLQAGLPVPTAKGKRDVSIPLAYVTDAPPVLGPGPKDVVSKQYAFHKKLATQLVPDPSVGLYSPTNSAKGGQLNTILTNARDAIIRGRKPATSWTDAVKSWRTAGGTTVGRELAAQYAARH